jgi:hypothetical protein
MRIDINVNFYGLGGELESKLAVIQSSLTALITKGNIMANTMDEVLALATDQATVAAGLQVAIDNLQQMVRDALANTTIPPGVQAQIDSAFAAFTANNAALAAALTDGTGPV